MVDQVTPLHHSQMAAPDPRQILVRMTSMLAVPLVGHEHPHERRRRRISGEVAEDDEPRPEAEVAVDQRRRDERAEAETEEQAAGVAHENAGGRPVEHEKPGTAHRERRKKEDDAPIGAAEEERQDRYRADADRAHRRQSIDPVDEIVEIHQPDQPQPAHRRRRASAA